MRSEWKDPPEGSFSADDKLSIHFVAVRGAEWQAGDEVHMALKLEFTISSRACTVLTEASGEFSP